MDPSATDGTGRARHGRPPGTSPAPAGAGDDGASVLAELTFPSEPRSVSRAVTALRAALEGVPALRLPDDRRASLETAVAEATSNAVVHGNEGAPTVTVGLRVVLGRRALVVRVSDQGRGGRFPVPAEPPDLEAMLRGDERPGGWGLFLMRHLVDDVRIEAAGSGRSVALLVWLDPATARPRP